MPNDTLKDWFELPTVGGLTRDRDAILRTLYGNSGEDKAKALAAMQKSPVSTDPLKNGIDEGQDAYMTMVHGTDVARRNHVKPEPTQIDPQWDAVKSWFSRNFTQKGQFQAAADAANAAPQEATPTIPTPPTPPAPPVQPGAVPGTPVTGDGWTLGDLLGTNPGTDAPVHPDNPTPEVDRNYAGQGQEVIPPTPAASVTEAPTFAQQLQPYKEFINSIYPQLDMSDSPKQVKADEFNANSLQRAKLMAQLALSAGIVAGAGYPDVAKGFAAAGGTYDDGFRRYNDALQDSADREMQKRVALNKNEGTRSGAAFSLYNDIAKQGREAVEKQRSVNIDFLKAGRPPAELATTDPEAYQAAYDKWYREYGQYANDGTMPAFDGDVRDASN